MATILPSQRTLNILTSNLVGPIYATTGDDSVTNTVVETDLIDSGSFIGTKTLPANFLSIGKTIRIKAMGFHNTTGSPTIQIRIRLGGLTGVIIATSEAHTLGSNTVNGGWQIETTITVRSLGVEGTVIGQGSSFFFKGSAIRDFDVVSLAPSVIDTTIPQVIVLSAEWGTAAAGNIITRTNTYIEVLN